MQRIDPKLFIGKELRPRLALIAGAAVADDMAIECEGRTVARVTKTKRAFGTEVWHWSITGPYMPPAMRPSSGMADSLAEAKQAIRTSFDRWLFWACAQGEDVPWFE